MAPLQKCSKECKCLILRSKTLKILIGKSLIFERKEVLKGLSLIGKQENKITLKLSSDMLMGKNKLLKSFELRR